MGNLKKQARRGLLSNNNMLQAKNGLSFLKNHLHPYVYKMNIILKMEGFKQSF
jgi:hypothetical protein